MELETLFTNMKWNIIQRISNTKESPLQLANNLKTSMANISQQLRLLEFAGLIKKERVSARDAGKPRMLFSLNNEFAFIISCTKENTNKKMIKLDSYHKIILNSWFIENTDLQKIVLSIAGKLEENITEIDMILFNIKNNKELIIVTEKIKLFEKISDKEKKIEIKILNYSEMDKLKKEDFKLIFQKHGGVMEQ